MTKPKILPRSLVAAHPEAGPSDSTTVRANIHNLKKMHVKKLPTIPPLVAALLILTPGSASADIPIPTITIVLPSMGILLVPIIALEAWIGVRRTGLEWKEAGKVSISANLLSTLLGIPFTHFVVGGAIYVLYGSTTRDTLPFYISMYLLQPFLLFPFWAPWAYPLAFLGLLIPTFFITFWIEKTVARLILRARSDAETVSTRWSLHANLASYSLIATVLSWLLALELLSLLTPKYAVHLLVACSLVIVALGTRRWGRMVLYAAMMAAVLFLSLLSFSTYRSKEAAQRAERRSAALQRADVMKGKILTHLKQDATDEGHIRRLLGFAVTSPDIEVRRFVIHTREGRILHSLDPKDVGANAFEQTIATFDYGSEVAVTQEVVREKTCHGCHDESEEEPVIIRFSVSY